jgi:hypothetical protein
LKKKYGSRSGWRIARNMRFIERKGRNEPRRRPRSPGRSCASKVARQFLITPVEQIEPTHEAFDADASLVHILTLSGVESRSVSLTAS